MARLSFEDIVRLVEQGDAKAGKAVDQMAHYLGCGIAMIVTGLAPDVLMVAGEVTRVWDRVGPVVEAVVRARSLTHATTRILPANPELQPRLRGTIALVLQKHFGAPFLG